MTDPLPVIINAEGGTAARLGDALIDQVKAAFATARLPVTIEAVTGNDIAARISAAAKTGAVVVGGGDGTQGTAAAICADARATLGVLPLGTRNHLARELGIPLDLPGAAAVIAEGNIRAIDLSTVNDRAFVNNASIGFYPEMVRARDGMRERHGIPKWLANLPAAWATLGVLRHRRFKLVMDGATTPVRTALLFVGNNVYSLDIGKLGQRDALDDGTLSVFAVAPNSRAGLIGFAMRAIIGWADPARDFAALGVCETLNLIARSHRIDVAIDGEIVALSPPLRFATRPAALAVFAPTI
jgi:diacylglycerol kinase family enzyme